MLNKIELASIPTRHDKITIDIKGIGFIFQVYDVHYADENMIDVNVVRLGEVTDYNGSGFPDIE